MCDVLKHLKYKHIKSQDQVNRRYMPTRRPTKASEARSQVGVHHGCKEGVKRN